MKRLCCAFVLALGCGSDPPAAAPETYLTRDELVDPASCAGCHPAHYREWSGSMHAYASDDPIFLAMNRLGQAEGQIGSFCVNCHAPMAVRTGATTDGLNLPDLPRALKGVTCYFCHSVDGVADTHDNPLHLASDDVLRAGLSDAVPNAAHRSTHSPFTDRGRVESSSVCGACHDIVNGHGTAIERTFAEFRGSAFADPSLGTTCGQCHMNQSKTPELVAVPAAAAGLKPRPRHGHQFPGVDLALSPFVEEPAQRAAVQDLLATTLQSALCVRGLGASTTLDVILDNVSSGHAFPSGSAQDRRLWVELVAYASDTPIYQSGVVPEMTSPTDLADPDLWLLRDCMFDASGAPAHMFWEAATYESNLLPAQATFNPSDARFYQSHRRKSYPRRGAARALPSYPDRVTLAVRLQPVGLDVIADLEKRGALSADEASALRPKLAPLTLGEPLVWTQATATEQFLDQGIPVSCISRAELSGAASAVDVPDSETCP